MATKLCCLFLFGVTLVFQFRPGCCFQQQFQPAQRTRSDIKISFHGSISQLGAAAAASIDDSQQQQRQEYSTYLSTCTPGLSHVLQQELEDLRTIVNHPDDIVDIAQSGNAAVTFGATREASLYALCWLRTAHRLLELVATTDYDNNNNSHKDDIDRDSLLYTRQDLYNFVRECVNAKDLLGDGKGGLMTMSVKAIMNNPRQLPKDLSHSHYTALSIKNSLCDVVRDLRGDRPDVDVDNPDVPLVAILRGMGNTQYDEGAASLSIYRSLHPPGSLHKRGYRAGGPIHKAAMKESMASGLLLEAGWKQKVEAAIATADAADENTNQHRLRMIDPMAGSGSFVLEACMMATDIAPGLMRIRCGIPNHASPPVTRWRKSSANDKEADEAWKTVLLDATQRAKAGIQRMRENPSLIQIEANDIHPRAVDIMESSLEAAGLVNFVRLSNMDCYELDGGKNQNDEDDGGENEDEAHGMDDKYFVATNPPWGIRLTEDIEESWEGLRHFIRDKCPSGTEVYVLSGDKTATGALKLKRDRMIPLQTGDQNLRWIQYTIGRKKKRTERQSQTGGGNYQKQQPQSGGYRTTNAQAKGKKFENAPQTAAASEDSWV
eukprot:CAMPEP_0168184364 /NCGR_PEP_ID=MMETSP0139_2-20121125/13189_1 /TAXON_ID=44445 /ORGANISM="Pseudo-nitzschia australis, Strain 10249 10 AB" /LENGTH=604 /DNA_ID=CAMNT_0008105959 /DNA_START=133 /DNA_END=1947 /DNA_ORIENTATION=+